MYRREKGELLPLLIVVRNASSWALAWELDKGLFQQSPNLPYSKGVGSLVAASLILVCLIERKVPVEGFMGAANSFH